MLYLPIGRIIEIITILQRFPGTCIDNSVITDWKNYWDYSYLAEIPWNLHNIFKKIVATMVKSPIRRIIEIIAILLGFTWTCVIVVTDTRMNNYWSRYLRHHALLTLQFLEHAE